MSDEYDYRYSSYHTDQQKESGAATGAKIAGGCGLGCLGVVLVGVIGVFLVMQYLQSKANDLADNFMTDEPMEIVYPEVQLHDVETVVANFDVFKTSLTEKQQVTPLSLSSDDINILINHHPMFKPIAGRTRVDIVDDQIQADLSLKVDNLPVDIPFVNKAVEGKYINGTATLSLNIGNGNSELYLLDFQAAEQSLPQQILDFLRSENLLQTAKNDPKVKEFLAKVVGIRIENNQLSIEPRKEAVAPATTPEVETESKEEAAKPDEGTVVEDKQGVEEDVFEAPKPVKQPGAVGVGE